MLARNKQRSSYKQLLLERQRLPVYGHRNELVSVFRRENTFIVAGETGSGKSTQVPQFLLEVTGRFLQVFCCFAFECRMID